MSLVDVLGFAAGSLTTVSFLPQVVKIWRTKSADDLSLGMLALFGSGVLLWLVYGIATFAVPVIVANAVTLALSITVIGLKLRYAGGRRPDGG
jgi:MtN3 and saliva related transmembrane protein